MFESAPDVPRRSLLELGVAAVAELLARPATSVDELATRLRVPPDELQGALALASIAPLIAHEPDGAMRAVAGATSATLPRRQRRALAPRRA
ncbi:MAG: hypothetical protein HS111_10055 [Kofleriaceae bacterium]|nr:hypothetical protein [Kofleriaceae bacterium]